MANLVKLLRLSDKSRFIFCEVISIRNNYSTKGEDFTIDLLENEVHIDDSNELEKIEEKCNKSRLLSQHRNMLNNCVPYAKPKAWYHETVRYKQKLYGKYGDASGINPGILWPSREQLDDKLEFEKVAHPDSIQDMLVKIAHNKEKEEELANNRQEEILRKVGKLEQWKQELNSRIMKKESDAAAAKAKKDRLVEEVRRHFGFKIDHRDDRFKELLEKKEKEEKKLAKEVKRKAKEAKALSKLAELSSQVVP